MKLLVPLLIVCLTNNGFSQFNRATAKDILAAKRTQLAENTRGGLVTATETEIQIQQPASIDIMDSSSFIVGALGYTLVPKGSVLNVGRNFTLSQEAPENLSHIQWDKFVRIHRNGLRLIPISQKLLLPDADTTSTLEKITQLKSKGVTCITTFNRQPVRISNSDVK